MTTDETLIWIAELFEESPENITIETLREDIPTWDSLGTLTLMAAMDEKFEILLVEKEIRSMNKIADIIEVLRTRGKLN